MSRKKNPTLDELREQLAEARNAYEMARFIDSTDRMLREQREWADEITRLLGAIRAMEAAGGDAKGNGSAKKEDRQQ
jgi:hypothetical protein